MKKIILLLGIFILILGCNDPKPRRPVSVKSGSSTDKSAERNKDLLALEEALFTELIQKDTVNTYFRSPNGYWFYYHIKADTLAYKPVEDDVVTFTYNMRSLSNDTIYSQKEIGLKTIKIDKEALFPGLRTGLKLMREGETITFLFPSSMVFGYHGDSKKIGVNVPLLSTVKLIEVRDRAKDSLIN